MKTKNLNPSSLSSVKNRTFSQMSIRGLRVWFCRASQGPPTTLLNLSRPTVPPPLPPGDARRPKLATSTPSEVSTTTRGQRGAQTPLFLFTGRRRRALDAQSISRLAVLPANRCHYLPEQRPPASGDNRQNIRRMGDKQNAA